MKLQKDFFEKIESGEQTIEIRLFDEKRKALRVGDIIEFSKLPSLHKKIQVKILELLHYESFENLIKDFGMKFFGYNQEFLIDSFLKNLYNIYTKDDEKQFGVLGIKLKVLQ